VRFLQRRKGLIERSEPRVSTGTPDTQRGTRCCWPGLLHLHSVVSANVENPWLILMRFFRISPVQRPQEEHSRTKPLQRPWSGTRKALSRSRAPRGDTEAIQ
jgi:hypothetical protein